MSWLTSWLPTLPTIPTINIAVPAAIQGRFISFVLKKFLGHLLKPGQLDRHQIDSQIGSGYVQVSQLELDPQAINVYLDGFPLSLKEGSISAVKARIPWPNPLASTVGLTLTSAHLVFHVISLKDYTPKPGADFSESITSVADSFMQGGLSSTAEDAHWRSIYQETAPHSSVHDINPIPGAMDVPQKMDNNLCRPDNDPAGVSVFASLIENLLARFEFDARDIKISLVHADNICLTLSLQEMRYQTDTKADSRTVSSAPHAAARECRTLSFVGISLSATQLGAMNRRVTSRNLNPVDESPQTGTLNALSRVSSNSSSDEETRSAMSRSLAVLPPRLDSPVDSVTSSMYMSALSMESGKNEDLIQNPVRSRSSTPASDPPQSTSTWQNREEKLISFGSQPVTAKLTTPSPTHTGSADDPFLSPEDAETSSAEELRIEISMNLVACVVQPWQIAGLLRLSEALVRRESQCTDSRSKTMDKPELPSIKVTLCARGLVLLLESTSFAKDTSLVDMADYFEQPLVPPELERGYTRIYLDTLVGSVKVSTTSTGGKVLESTTRVNVNLADLSILSFASDQTPSRLKAFPLVITDRYLPAQYPNKHLHPESGAAYPTLPTIDLTNWTDGRNHNASGKLSHWRNRSAKSEVGTLNTGIQFRGSRTVTSIEGKHRVFDVMDIQIAPLHVRLDLATLVQPGGILSFFDEFLSLETNTDDGRSDVSDDTVDDSAQRTGISDVFESPFGEPVYDHIALGMKKSPDPGAGLVRHTLVDTAASQSVLSFIQNDRISRLTVNVAVIRLSLRCPPPPQSNQRSGIIVIDIHDINTTIGSTPTEHHARFATHDDFSTRHLGDSDQLKVHFRRAVLASSLVGANSATAFASIGSLVDNREEGSHEYDNEKPAPLRPCVQLMQLKAASLKTIPAMAISINIPSIHVDLSKSHFDGLQYFADDVAQFLERMSADTHSIGEPENDSRETSLIGSLFFAKSRAESLNSSVAESEESVIKLTTTEVFIRIGIPRRDDDFHCRPFDLKASDLDILLELNPHGKQQTVLTVGVLDITAMNTAKDQTTKNFFSLTSLHPLTTAPKSIVKFTLATSTAPECNTKETRVKLTMCGFTYTFFPDLNWIVDVIDFGKNPPGTFDSVIPSDRTRISVKIIDGSIQLFAPNHSGSLVAHLQELEFSTDVVGDSRDSSFHINASSISLLALDDGGRRDTSNHSNRSLRGVAVWTASGYALFAEVSDLDTFIINHLNTSPEWKVDIHRITLRTHVCADTLTLVGCVFSDFGTLGKSVDNSTEPPDRGYSVINSSRRVESNPLSSVDDLTFKRMPEIGPAPDMISDDLPTNVYYLDDSFGAAAGLREIRDDDVDDFENEEIAAQASDDPTIISRVGGETIKILDPHGLDIVEDYFLSIPPETTSHSSDLSDSKIRLRIFDGNFNIFLYDGYDWARTRKIIEEEVKEMRKRLAKIRQLVAKGHVEDSSLDDTSAFLFNSIHIGLDDDEGALGEPAALIAAIDRELKDDMETTSWQSLPTFNASKPRVPSIRVHGKRLTRSRGPSIEISLHGLRAEFDRFYDDDSLVSRTFVTVRDVEILDHIKTSTWKKFLTQLRSDSKGNVRETGSDMVRVELRGVRPVPGHPSEEARLKAKLLPLRLYVDQDAVDFMKKFFSFEDPAASNPNSSDTQEAYIQYAEIFPVDLKLDYKPRRVDYRALKQGKTIELMNFFHFDGAEMTLRHITLSGITGWGKLFEMLNDLWTPDVKATQLAEVISGVSPIRSMVNVGSGVADLILLPIAQYKKDGRIVRGIQKGTKAFVKSTAIEAVKMGAKLATGTQVILEQAEGILGGNFEVPITAEPLQPSPGDDFVFESDDVEEEALDLRSKYAQQPADITEGVQVAYKSLRRNFSSAAQTILAVPMEVYERSGSEGPVRSVIRAVPIAVLKPMIGATEAVSKTLQGLHNTLDPNVRHENEAKYKR